MQRKTIIHKSLYKPLLFVGCERLPFTFVITLGGILIMAYQTPAAFILVLIFYIGAIGLIRRVNENDPQYFKCLVRYLCCYTDYYPANAFYPGRIDKPYTYFE